LSLQIGIIRDSLIELLDTQLILWNHMIYLWSRLVRWEELVHEVKPATLNIDSARARQQDSENDHTGCKGANHNAGKKKTN